MLYLICKVRVPETASYCFICEKTEWRKNRCKSAIVLLLKRKPYFFKLSCTGCSIWHSLINGQARYRDWEWTILSMCLYYLCNWSEKYIVIYSVILLVFLTRIFILLSRFGSRVFPYHFFFLDSTEKRLYSWPLLMTWNVIQALALFGILLSY